MNMIKMLFCTIITAVFASMISGCASNEKELRDNITGVFDAVALPVKVLVRQFDNGFDALMESEISE